MVPRLRASLESEAFFLTNEVPFPTIKLFSVGSREAMSASSSSYACTSEPMARPKLVLAPSAVEEPVPPSVIAISVDRPLNSAPVISPPVMVTLFEF